MPPASATLHARGTQAAAARVAAVFTAGQPGLGITSHGPGCAVAVSEAAQIVYQAGFGLANLANGVPITPATPMEIGSIAKQFTAASILLLATQGKLSLDTDIHRYVPELPAYPHPMALRDLLWMESGLADYADPIIAQNAGYTATSTLSASQVLALITKLTDLSFVPGTEFAYSNTNYVLLGLVVERVSGQSLGAFEQANIFGPLGMQASESIGDLAPAPSRAATSYAILPNFTLGAVVPRTGEEGDAGIYSTVLDLLRWAANFGTGGVGGPGLLAAQLDAGPRAVPLDAVTTATGDLAMTHYAAGLFLSTYQGETLIWHNGSDAGYRSGLLMEPSAKLAVAVACNTAVAGDGFTVAFRVLRAWSGA
jgi:CubicO group peptidase (beta-lactamase class C family)